MERYSTTRELPKWMTAKYGKRSKSKKSGVCDKLEQTLSTSSSSSCDHQRGGKREHQHRNTEYVMTAEELVQTARMILAEAPKNKEKEVYSNLKPAMLERRTSSSRSKPVKRVYVEETSSEEEEGEGESDVMATERNGRKKSYNLYDTALATHTGAVTDSLAPNSPSDASNDARSVVCLSLTVRDSHASETDLGSNATLNNDEVKCKSTTSGDTQLTSARTVPDSIISKTSSEGRKDGIFKLPRQKSSFSTVPDSLVKASPSISPRSTRTLSSKTSISTIPDTDECLHPVHVSNTSSNKTLSVSSNKQSLAIPDSYATDTDQSSTVGVKKAASMSTSHPSQRTVPDSLVTRTSSDSASFRSPDCDKPSPIADSLVAATTSYSGVSSCKSGRSSEGHSHITNSLKGSTRAATRQRSPSPDFSHLDDLLL